MGISIYNIYVRGSLSFIHIQVQAVHFWRKGFDLILSGSSQPLSCFHSGNKRKKAGSLIKAFSVEQFWLVDSERAYERMNERACLWVNIWTRRVSESILLNHSYLNKPLSFSVWSFYFLKKFEKKNRAHLISILFSSKKDVISVDFLTIMNMNRIEKFKSPVKR